MLSARPTAAQACDDEQLAACEEVMAIADVAIKRQAETIAALSDQNVALKKALDTAAPIINAPQPWYENKYLWLAVGVGAGAYIGGR